MFYSLAAALVLMPGAVLAQDNPRTVGVSVGGTVMEVPVEVAAKACGVDGATLLEEWEQLDIELPTMAGTSVSADATDLAPGAAAGTPMPPDVAAGTDPSSNAEGASSADPTDKTHAADIDPALDPAAATTSGEASTAAENPTASVVAEAASPGGEPTAAETKQTAATGDSALAKAAVCEVSAEAAAQVGIVAPN